MHTKSKDETNRANAQHSTGPRTEQGKAKSSQNRTIHGLAGDRVLLPGESQEAYNARRQRLIDQHRPQGDAEMFLVEQLTHNAWRLTRIWEMEAEIITAMSGYETDNESTAAHAAYGMIETCGSPAEAHFRLQRYDTAVRRAYSDALTQLRVTQAARIRGEEKEEKARQREQAREEKANSEPPPPPPPAQPVEKQNCDSNPTPPPVSPSPAPEPPARPSHDPRSTPDDSRPESHDPSPSGRVPD